ncbi:MAG: hypothetical protein PVF68_13155 [Acidobacteriota bacterium]
MTFVPVFTSPPAPSPRAMELGNRIAQQIREFRAVHPDLDGDDVSQAFRIATSLVRPEVGRAATALTIASLTAGLLAALLLGLFLFQKGAWPGGTVAFAIVGVGVLASVMALLKAAGRKP